MSPDEIRALLRDAIAYGVLGTDRRWNGDPSGEISAWAGPATRSAGPGSQPHRPTWLIPVAIVAAFIVGIAVAPQLRSSSSDTSTPEPGGPAR